MYSFEQMWAIFLDTPQFWLAAGAIVCTIGVVIHTAQRDKWKGRVVTPKQIMDYIEAGEDPLIWDIRKRKDIKKLPKTLKGAMVLRMEEIPTLMKTKNQHRRFADLADAEVFIVDDIKMRSAMAGRMLQQYGLKRVAVMDGKIKDWIDAGYETDDVSIEDQEQA